MALGTSFPTSVCLQWWDAGSAPRFAKKKGIEMERKDLRDEATVKNEILDLF